MPCPEKPKKPTQIKHEHTLKGCIHWFDPDGSTDSKISSQKARPYIIIGLENPRSIRVIMAPVSGRENYVEPGTNTLKYPYHAPLDLNKNPFLEKDSVALLDQVYTIPKLELCEEWYMGKINNNEDLDKAIMYNYDLFETTFKIYKELFEELRGTAKAEYMKRFNRK
jgi:mRNA interferase MazF